MEKRRIHCISFHSKSKIDPSRETYTLNYKGNLIIGYKRKLNKYQKKGTKLHDLYHQTSNQIKMEN